MKLLKNAAKKVLRTFGYDVVPYKMPPKSSPVPFFHNRFDHLYYNLIRPSADTITIFDVGSHKGESVDRFTRLFPVTIVHAFEPDQENFKSFARFIGFPNIYPNNCGVGATKGALTFHRYKKSDVGGFNPIKKDDTWTKIRSNQYNSTPEEFELKAYEVPVVTVDDYMREKGINHINLLKIDTQGFEDEVLKGSANALQNNAIDYIEMELIIKGPYSKTLQFKAIEDILTPYGYTLYGIESASNYYDTPILQFDLLFARKGAYKEGPYSL